MNNFQAKLIEQSVRNFDKLSTWERQFIGTIQNYPENKNLSEAQNAVLNRIGGRL